MNNAKVISVILILSSVLSACPVMSAIIRVSGPLSILGDLPKMISAPGDVDDDAAYNTSMEGFNEQQGITLPEPVEIDDGTIAEGTTVSSHMIFLNTGPGDDNTLNYHDDVTWTFDGKVLGVMSDSEGLLEAATSELLGATGTSYPSSFPSRGMESGDSYVIDGNHLIVSMSVTEPGDWIRVITVGKKKVRIDIKPGSALNCFNLNRHGVVPVAILGTEDFDPCTAIDPDSLSLLGMTVRAKGIRGSLALCEDVNADSYLDLVVQFEADSAKWSEDQTSADLTGSLLDGTPIVGTDSICLTPKRKQHKLLPRKTHTLPQCGGR